ncbi:NAD(P)-binding domain-containing protein [Algoriphagus sp. CAU 1675]|uniref:NADPH-dependent F420 reductase n=1 Tax=Algoriphagus sp. CAU 1675 TaxID=3032597 RepID=UPI0023DCCDC7|nr:NAD(P)-binding domain-containing protein [Algoriphagus sp. CAU 1675]MDF2157874.1 NAD(P)-binding domain-containing protein [Algoriphagus sp. CAU 1675]
MKLGILGGTNLGKSLGKKYLNAGIDVVFGVRPDFDTEETEWKILNRFYDKLCPYDSAIIQSEIILICCENQYLSQVCQSLRRVDLEDKIIIDCTNSKYTNKLRNSNTQMIQRSAANAIVFKAFNNLGLDYPNSDTLGIIKETFFCGDSIPEKIRIKRLIELIGFKAIDAGKMTNATLLEAFYHLGKEITWNKQEASNYHFKLVSV